jgi:hypothetical protein
VTPATPDVPPPRDAQPGGQREPSENPDRGRADGQATRSSKPMNRSEALAERDRLVGLLAAYNDHRTAKAQNHRSDLPHEITPDRAAKVRARIASLDEIIDGHAG